MDWKLQRDAVEFIGIDAIHSFGLAQCRSCWKLEYGDKHKFLFAIDSADSGFVLSLNAMQYLTGGQARELVRIDAKATQVDVSNCGIINIYGYQISMDEMRSGNLYSMN